MMTRSLTSAILATLGATTLLASTALAAATVPVDSDSGEPTPSGAAIAQLARTTTAVGEAKGDAISTAATADRSPAASSTDAEADAHGDTVSALARKTAPDTEHGETVSAAASSGATAHTTSSSAPGAGISHLATSTTATGEAKGDAISAAARKNRSSR